MKTHWSHWQSSGKPHGWPHLHQVAAGRNQDGRLEIFSVSTDGKLWQIWQTAPNGGWSHWETRGAPDAEGIDRTRPSFGRTLVVGRHQDGRLEVCVVASGRVWCIEQTSPNNGWGSWQALGVPPGFIDVVSLDLVRKNDGRLQLLALSRRDSLATRRQAAPNGEWQDWDTALPSQGSTSVVGHDTEDGTLRIIVMVSGSVPALAGERPGFGTTGISTADRDPFSMARNQDGRLEAAMIIKGQLVTIREHIPNQLPSPGGSGWERHDLMQPSQHVTVRNPSLSTNRDGSLSVFAQGSDGHLWMRRQTAPSGNWGDWHDLGAPTDNGEGFLSVTIGQNQDGRLEAFVVHEGELWHTWETA